MEKNKIIILALIVVIAALLVGIVATMQIPHKQETKLAFKCNATITEGDSIRIQLTDANGTAIANQNVNVTITDKDKTNDYHSVVTNANGVGTLNIDKKAGNYIVTIKYDGNDNYSACNATKKIKIEEKVVEAETTSSSTPAAYAYRSDGSPMYSQQEVSNYMLNKYGMVNYHIGSNGYIDMDEPGYDDAGHRLR